MRSGLTAVFLQNRDALLRFLRARSAADSAEDFLQELWLKITTSGASEPISDPLAYLYRAANNLLLDRRQAEVRRARREQEWSCSAAWHEHEASDYFSGERQAVARDELRLAESALSNLGERTETIFRRFRIDGATQPEIAREMGISLSAVEKHLQKAYHVLLQLKKQLDAG